MPIMLRCLMTGGCQRRKAPRERLFRQSVGKLRIKRWIFRVGKLCAKSCLERLKAEIPPHRCRHVPDKSLKHSQDMIKAKLMELIIGDGKMIVKVKPWILVFDCKLNSQHDGKGSRAVEQQLHLSAVCGEAVFAKGASGI